ncbi:MAG TPA: hypothetical protein VFS97_10835 [Nitrososphaeraceae archaeon]|nr:hypothetical protein [Nitrososphaeraceae archaeon]
MSLATLTGLGKNDTILGGMELDANESLTVSPLSKGLRKLEDMRIGINAGRVPWSTICEGMGRIAVRLAEASGIATSNDSDNINPKRKQIGKTSFAIITSTGRHAKVVKLEQSNGRLHI